VNAPVKGDILIKRLNNPQPDNKYNCGGFSVVKVCGVYPSQERIAYRFLVRFVVGVEVQWDWSVSTNRTDGYFQNGQWRCAYNKKLTPKALPDAPIAPQATIRQVPPHIVEELQNNYELLHLTFDKEYECPICLGIIEGADLHITKCGHFYCKGCIAGLPPQWERTQGCPQCRARA
jgi:hypothetical protein